jgi:cytochrome c-type biogenesis protein
MCEALEGRSRMDVGAFAAFGAGLLSFLSPCVLPLVPPYLCFLAGVSIEDLTSGRQQAVSSLVLTRAVSFVLGFATVFVALGASASYLGQLVSEHLTLLSRIAGVIVLGLGLHMLGVFRLLTLSREARVHVERRPTTALGAYVVGLAFAFGWSPCVGPVLASILLIAGSDDSIGEGRCCSPPMRPGSGCPFFLPPPSRDRFFGGSPAFAVISGLSRRPWASRWWRPGC